MASFIDDPFADPTRRPTDSFGGIAPALPRVPGVAETDVTSLGQLDDLGSDLFPDLSLPTVTNVTDPVGKYRNPTAFQQGKINWADGYPKTPTAYDPESVANTDFLEVDYMFGRKEGAGSAPVLAANIFGRQVSREELERDDEGRRLLDLMETRRRGDINSGGSLANFAKGFANWSTSDIPFYGWVSDLGATAGEAIDIAKTMRKLQDGEKVTVHEAVQARRFMLQQELESTRTMSYNVGSVVRQAIPFMGEMFATSLATAAVAGAATGGIGAVPGAIVGAAITPLRWLFGAGRAAAKAGARKVVNASMASIAKKSVADITGAEFASVARAGFEAYGAKGYREILRDMTRRATAELGEGATRAETRRLARKMVAEELQYARKFADPSALATRTLFSADYRLALEDTLRVSAEKMLLKKVGYDVTKHGTGLAARDRLLKVALPKAIEDGSWGKFVKGVASSIAKDGNTPLTAAQITRQGLARTTGGWVPSAYATKVTESVAANVMRNIELRYGGRAFATPERLYRYVAEHALRGLVQTEHMLGGVAPTLAHSGFSTFTRCSDALKEGLGRVLIEAPVRAAAQVGIQLPLGPLFAAAHGRDPSEVVYKGQLGRMATALVTGDRDNLESARMASIGSMFVEYMSENAGRGLGLSLGGALGLGKTTAAVKTARDAFVTPLTRKAGSLLDKAVEASFGTNPFAEGTAKLAEFGIAAVNKWANKVNVSVSDAEVRRVFATKSLDGISDGFRRALESKGIKGYSGFKYAVASDARNNRRAHALVSFIGATLMERGMTPDKIVALFRQSGYDGILEEMGEERLGDFVRGLFHVDDTASDASVKERLKSMFHGFADFEQLATEFIGFAIPGSIRRAAMGTQKWLATGSVARLRESAASLKSLTDIPHRGPVSVVAVNRAADAVAVREHQRKSVELKETALGSTDNNRKAYLSNVEQVRSSPDTIAQEWTAAVGEAPVRQAPITREGQIELDAHRAAVTQLLDGVRQDSANTDALVTEFAEDLVSMPTERELETAIEQRGAGIILGQAGVDAVRREWRKREGHEFSDAAHPVEQSLQEWKTHEAAPVEVDRTPLTAEEAARTVYAQVESGAKDRSITSEQLERASAGGTSTVVDSNVRDTAVENALDLITYMGRAQNHMEAKMSWGRRALSRAVGVLAASMTGDLALAANNPAMWLAEDQGLDKNIIIGGLFAYNAGLLEGFRKVSPSFTADIRDAFGTVNTPAELRRAMAELAGKNVITADLYDQIEEAGREEFEKRVRNFITDYLSASGIMLTTKEDVDAMAERVAKTRGDGDIDAARNDIIDGVLSLARNAVGYSTHAQQGRQRTSITIDVARALKAGSKPEVLAAIMASPAYRNVARIANVSSMSETGSETVFSALFADSADLERVLEADIDNADVDERDIAEVLTVLHKDAADYTPGELQDMVKGFIRRARLVREGISTTYTRIDPDATRTAELVPVGAGVFVVRVTANGVTESETQYSSFNEAKNQVMSDGYAPDRQRIVVSHLTQFASDDATSLLFLHYGNDPVALREAYIRSLGDEFSERYLPPVCRMAVKQDGAAPEFLYTPEEAAAKFREELALAKEYRDNRDNEYLYLPGKPLEERRARRDAAKAAYETVTGIEGGDIGYESRAEQLLLRMGVRRNQSTSGVLNNIGVSENAFVMRADAVSSKNTLVISPDYATSGHGEALLRHGIRQALNSYVSAGPDLDLRRQLLVQTVREFRDCGKSVAEGLRRSNRTEEASRVEEVLESVFPMNITGVTTDAIAAIASSSILFSCDRGTYAEGNGFLRSTEIARVADVFRSRDIFPVFASAIDEALGGIGLFHVSSVSSGTGLSRFNAAFKPSPAALARARESAAFGGTPGKAKAPFITSLRIKEGSTRDMVDTGAPIVEVDTSVGFADSDGMRFDEFDGDTVTYLKRIVGSTVAFTEAYMKLSGGTAKALSAAQVFRLARNAGLCGGDTRETVRVAPSEIQPKIEEHDRHVRSVAKNALASAGNLTVSDGVSDAAAEMFGAALRTVSDAVGADHSRFRSVMREFLLDHQAPMSVVTELLAAYDSSSVVIRRAEDEAADMVAAETAETESLEDSESTNDPDHERRTAEFTTNQDIIALSGTLRWVFPELNGNVSATILALRDELKAGRLFNDKAVRKLAEQRGANADEFAADIKAFTDALSINDKLTDFPTAIASSVFANTDSETVDRVLNRVIAVLSRSRQHAFAIAVAAIKNIPDQNGRRGKLLSMLSQATQVDPLRLDRGDPRSPFDISPVGTRIQSQAAPAAITVAYTSLMQSPRFEGTVKSTPDFKGLANMLAATRQGLTIPKGVSSLDALVIKVPFKGGNRKSRLVAMDQSMYDTLMGLAEGKKPEDVLGFFTALDVLQASIAKRMAIAADVYDAVVGPGSAVSRMLRDKGTIAAVRRDVETIVVREGKSPFDKPAIEALINMANYFTAHPSTNKSVYPDALWRTSSFIADFIEEPLEGLWTELTGERFAFATKYVDPEYLAKRLQEAHAKNPITPERVRGVLETLAFSKSRANIHVENGADVEQAYKLLDETWKPGTGRTKSSMQTLVESYIRSRPRSSASLGGRSASLVESAKNRSVQTLPSQLPGYVRLLNSELCRKSGLQEELVGNGNRWDDGSNILVSFVGAKDVDDSLLPKEALAGVVNTAITEAVSSAPQTHYIFPFFRADKPACYAIRMPVRAVNALIETARKDAAGVPVKVAELANKEPESALDTYKAGYAIVATMLGQSDIDPKRVPVLSSVGGFIAPYAPGDDGTIPDNAGLYIVSSIGGVSGASLMGGYSLTGVLADRVSGLMPGKWCEAQKLHMFNAATGVNFKKGQATTRKIEDYLMGRMVVTNGAERFSLDTICRTIEKSAGIKTGTLMPLQGISEGQDQSEYDSYVAEHSDAMNAALKFLKHSSVMGDDLETNKAGLFGSSCGFSEVDAEGKPLSALVIDGVEVLSRDAAGNWQLGKDVPAGFRLGILDEIKNGQIPIAMAFAAYIAATRKSIDAGSVVSVWRKPDGTVVQGTLAETGLLSEGETLNFEYDEAGQCTRMTFFTRAMLAQIVASNSSPSTASLDHVFPTNATRDHWMLETLNAQRIEGESSRFIDAHSAFSMFQLSDIDANPWMWVDRVIADPELSELIKAHPNDNDVRDAVSSRVRAFYSRQMIVPFYGNHGIMVPSGGKVAEKDEFRHLVKIEWAPGTTQYDKDCYRPATVYTTSQVDYYGHSRSWGSGSVNARVPGFRYGLHLDEAKFDTFMSGFEWTQELKDQASELASLEGADIADARRAVALEQYLEQNRGKGAALKQLLSCFTDYTGRPASETWSANSRFDDLWVASTIRGGTVFDRSAIGVGKSARVAPDGTRHLYLAGSPFHAHRSPSGNIAAASGTVRATCPRDFDAITGKPGATSEYSLDPVTTDNQGSDFDGDSASLQFPDYGATGVTFDDVHELTAEATDGKDIRAFARSKGWTETLRGGEEVIKPSVYRAIARLVFDAQVSNYFDMDTWHQGYNGLDPQMNARGTTVSGAWFADTYLDEGTPDGMEFADCGFAGRHPVGTDAVYGEPLTPETLSYVLKNLSSKVPESVKAKIVLGAKMNKVFEACVNSIQGKPVMSLIDNDSVAVSSDAASDSAKARGISVANQSLFLRTQVEGYEASPERHRGASQTEAREPFDENGYSASIDFTGHVDGISNNLFDTLKKMFATRAGWTRNLLPVFLGRLAYKAQSNPVLDSAFFLCEAVNFMCEVFAEGGGYRADTVVGRLARYLDPVTGRKSAIAQAKGHISKVNPELGSVNEDGSFKIGKRRFNDESSVSSIVSAFYKAYMGKDADPASLDEKFIVAAAYMNVPEAKATSRSYAMETMLYRRVARYQALVKDYGATIDYMKITGKDFGALAKLKDDPTESRELSAESEQQYLVASHFTSSVLGMSDTSETLEHQITQNVDRRPWEFAKGSLLRDNFDRLIHLVGAYRNVRPGLLEEISVQGSSLPEALEGFIVEGMEEPTPTTKGFLANMAATVRFVSDNALVKAVKSDDPLARLLASLSVDLSGEVGLYSKESTSSIKTLREGFDQLMTRPVSISIRDTAGNVITKVSGREFGNLLVLYASMTRTFGAAKDYATQSNLPAVFGDARIAALEEWRGTILNDEQALRLVGVPTVKAGALESFDIFGSVELSAVKENGVVVTEAESIPVTTVLNALQQTSGQGSAFDRVVLPAVRQGARTVEANGTPVGSARQWATFGSNTTADMVPADYVVPLRTASRITDVTDDPAFDALEPEYRDSPVFPVLPVTETGTVDRNARPERYTTTIEDAYNLTVLDMYNVLSKSDSWVADADAYKGANGRPYLMHNPRSRQSLLSRIIEDAARNDPALYDMMAKLNDYDVVRFPDEDVTAAFNRVVNKVAEGSLDRPQVRASYGAGVTVTRARVEQADPGRQGGLTGTEAKSTKEAIRAALTQVFGESVDIEEVTSDDGAERNLMKVTRKTKSRRTVVTYIRIGATVGEDLTAKAVAESLTKYVNSQRAEGSPKITAARILEMGESNVRQLGKILARSGAQLGESVPGHMLDFAPAMSGIINLTEYADFRTLFHEYYHQMIACFKTLGVLTAHTENAINKELGGEEAAADRFAEYVTGMGGREDDVELRRYLTAEGQISDQALDAFSRFYAWSKGLARAMRAGSGPDDKLPRFIQVVVLDGKLTKQQLAKVTELSDDELAEAELRIAGEGPHAVGPLWTDAGLTDIVKVRREVIDDLINDDIRSAQLHIMAFDTKYRAPIDTAKTPEETVVASQPTLTQVFSPEHEGTVEGKVSAFIKKALTKYANALEDSELSSVMNRWRDAIVDDGVFTGPDASLFYTTRRFIRYVAAAEGIELFNEDGSLNRDGEALFASHNVAALAIRYLSAATSSRGDNDTENERAYATHASADWAFARAIETVSPASYGNYARSQAAKCADLFRTMARALLNKSGRTQAELLVANEFLDKARTITVYTEDLIRGNDIRHLISGYRTDSVKERPYGLLFKMFTGGAQFGAKHAHSDGVLRYSKTRVHTNTLETGDAALDPMLTMAYDLAAQALFVAHSGHQYRRQMLDEKGKDESPETPIPEPSTLEEPALTEAEEAVLSEALSEGIAVEAGDEAEAAREADLNESAPVTAGDFYADEIIDITSGPQWVLANEGKWLAEDMMANLSGVPLRDMMTDHEVKAVTESKYRLAMDFVQFFGLDTHVGDGLRYLEFTKSSLGRNTQGDFAIGKDHEHDIMRFSNTRGALLGMFNWQEKRVGDPITEADWKMSNCFGRLVKLVTTREHRDLLGIELADAVNASDAYHLSGDLNWYSPARLLERQASGERLSALDRVLLQVLDTVVMDVVKGNNSQDDYTSMTDIGSGFYGDLVRNISEAVKNSGAEASKTQVMASVVERLSRMGLCHKGGRDRTVLCVDVARYSKAWRESVMYGKLLKTGRPARMLNEHYWAAKFGKAVNEMNSAAAKSSYLSAGVGSNFTLAGTSCFWFHGGTGSHMAKVSRFQRGIDALAGMTPSAQDVIEAKHSELADIISNSTPDRLRRVAVDAAGKSNLTVRELRYLAMLMGQLTDMSSKFDVKRFANRIANGYFEQKVENAPVTIRRDATVFDIRCTICDILVNRAFDRLMSEKDMPNTERQVLLDQITIAEQLRGQLSGTVPGKVNATTELAEFERTGRLGDSRTAPEALIQMCKGLVTAERFRGCLAQMLTSLTHDGMPAFIVDPTDAMTAVNKMPDEYWGALARNVVRFASHKVPTLAYDDALSGVENMHRIYEAFNADKVGGLYGNLDVNKYNGHRMFRGILCHKGSEDPAGNVNVMTRMQGGEAAAYMKMLLGTLSAPTTESAWRWFDRVTSWSKISSVGFSAFFQIATAIESPFAAVGFWKTIAGLTETGGKLGRKFTGSDMPFTKDLVRLLNSNDPFMCEAREFCDLIGMPVDTAVPFYGDPNDGNPVLGDLVGVKRDIDRWSEFCDHKIGSKYGKAVRKMMEFGYKHPTDYTFNVILTGVKMATVMQTLRRLREECAKGDRPFDPVVAMRRYATYIDAEVGGIDPARYAWATPGMRRLLSLSMFSWQWTVGAWAAGGGEAISDMLFGGHSTNSEMRQFALVRWMRMLGIVKFGIPMFMQAAIKAVSTAAEMLLRTGDPDDEALADELSTLPWFAFNNESKAGALSFDITPILKIAARVPAVRTLKKADIPIISALVPAYVGEGRNTTGKRRYYMHFGKQSDEFFRWFTEPMSQLVSKMSIPMQKGFEGFFGRLQPNGYAKGFADMSFIDRWFNLSFDADQSALWNLISGMGSSFSWQSVNANPDAGILAAVGPIRMGQSKRSTRLRIVERLSEFVDDDRTNNPWSYGRNRRKFNLMCTDILREAQMNGVDPADIMTSAIGDLAHVQYDKLFAAMPKDLDSVPDVEKMREAFRALSRLNRRFAHIKSNLVQKFKAAGTDIKKNREYYAATLALLRATLNSPYLGDDSEYSPMFEYAVAPKKSVRSTQMAAGAGEGFGNFLATDEVPETLFGVPIVTSGYTKGDTEFFKAFPEAGGFYDLGDNTSDDDDPEPPDGGKKPKTRAGTGAGDAMTFMNRNPSLFTHVKAFEKFRAEPYEDIGGYAIGYGAHSDADGNPVTVNSANISESEATEMLARDLYARRQRMAKVLPNWKYIPGSARQALLDVAMGRDDVLSATQSKWLHRDLKSAGRDPNKLLAAVKKHYYSYRKTDDPRHQAGLEARRVAGGKLFFGEDFSYEGKTWDPVRGFVAKGGL